MAGSWLDIGRMDELGRMDTPLHRLDARAKVLVTLLYVAVVMSFPRHAFSALTPLLLYPVLLMVVARIPLRDLAKKIAVAAPFALLVGIANPFLDPSPAIRIDGVTLSYGWLSFFSILFRFVLTVGAALILVACTGMFRLGAGLERLGVPRVFVMQLLFLYRYLFVVSGESIAMKRAVELRGGRARGLGLRVYASLVGTLLLRSLDRAGRVYRAMLARGFDGEIRLLEVSRFGLSEWMYVSGWAAFFLAVRAVNLAEWAGRLVKGVAI